MQNWTGTRRRRGQFGGTAERNGRCLHHQRPFVDIAVYSVPVDSPIHFTTLLLFFAHVLVCLRLFALCLSRRYSPKSRVHFAARTKRAILNFVANSVFVFLGIFGDSTFPITVVWSKKAIIVRIVYLILGIVTNYRSFSYTIQCSSNPATMDFTCHIVFEKCVSIKSEA